MSAIFGLWHRDGRPCDPPLLQTMSDRLRHRGPDHGGDWREGPVGLGQRILPTTPESLQEDGPARGTDAGLVLVADARLDNRAELLTWLDLGPAHGSIPDSQLLLHAYRRWGRAIGEKLLGDFALAIWHRERNAFFCARDPMGVRPFYYHCSDRLFAFATEMKALLTLPGVSREVDEVQIGHFLDFQQPPEERTLYRDVRRLPAAHWMEVEADGTRTGRYWAADAGKALPPASDEEYAEAFREVFAEAVRCRLRSALPVGAALSGGLDSSSIVAMARRIAPAQPLTVVSAVFPELPEPERTQNDESRFIDAVAERLGLDPIRVRADRLGVFDYLEPYFLQHDAAPFAFMLWMRWNVYEEAAARGVRVFLSGDDGDTVVSHGYERFFDLARAGEWTTATREVKALAARANLDPVAALNAYVRPSIVRLAEARRWRDWSAATRDVARSYGFSHWGFAARTMADAVVPERLRGAMRRIRGGRPEAPLLRPEFARRIGLRETGNGAGGDGIPSARESHASILPSAGLQYLLEITDSISGAFGIETRCPFLDRRVVEFCLALPSDQKLADGWTRVILRRSMEGILPPEVQWRTHKADLVYAFIRRLRGEDRGRLASYLFEGAPVLADYVDMDALRALHRRFDAGGTAGARTDSGLLYIAAVLSRWLRELDARPVGESGG